MTGQKLNGELNKNFARLWYKVKPSLEPTYCEILGSGICYGINDLDSNVKSRKITQNQSLELFMIDSLHERVHGYGT